MATIPVGTKFLGVDPNFTDLTERKGGKVDRKTEYFSLEDLQDSISSGGDYKVYRAILNQTGTSDPVATVLENTVGNIAWTRDSAGYYIGTLTGVFLLNKTFILTPFVELNQFEDKVYIYRENNDVIALRSYLGGTQDDGLINHFPIEILVYN